MRFMKRNLYFLDCFGHPFFYSLAAIEWFCLRMELLSTFVFAFYMNLLVSIPHGSIDPSMAGHAVILALIRMPDYHGGYLVSANLKTKLFSLKGFTNTAKIPGEAPLIIENSRPPSLWPENGIIELIDLKVRYKESLPAVFHSVICRFPGGNKIRIVSVATFIATISIDVTAPRAKLQEGYQDKLMAARYSGIGSKHCTTHMKLLNEDKRYNFNGGHISAN